VAGDFRENGFPTLISESFFQDIGARILKSLEGDRKLGETGTECRYPQRLINVKIVSLMKYLIKRMTSYFLFFYRTKE